MKLKTITDPTITSVECEPTIVPPRDWGSDPAEEVIPLPPFWTRSPELSERSRVRPIRRNLVYRAIYLLGWLALKLGIRRAVHLALRLAKVGFWVQRRESRVVIQNLENCFGKELTDVERECVAEKVYSHVCVSFAETVWMSRWKELRNWLEFEFDGWENLEVALAEGKGVICPNGHFGNWEVMCAVVAQLGYPGYIVARYLREPRLEDWLNRVRQNLGVRVITRGREPIRLVRILRQGGILGVMIDLDTHSGRGIFVDFFGRPAYTQVGPFVLARRTGAAIVPALCYREGLNRLRFHFGKPWHVEVTEDSHRDIQLAAQRATTYLEQRIRERPEQWMWFHKRWKTTPERVARNGERSLRKKGGNTASE